MTPRQKKTTAATAAALTAASLLTLKLVTGPPAPPTITLAWSYPAHGPEIVFNVRSGADCRRLKTWPIVATVSNQVITLQRSNQVGTFLFTVTASNTQNHMESGFATK